MKDQYKIGGLYKVISEHGEEKDGPGMLLGIHEPYTLRDVSVESRNLWHVSILHGSKIQHYNTSTWTLVPLDPDSCNP
jgi:hypothetical protein